ncbi:hypothetical protein GCM10009548_89170 [Streptomyces malaysiensis subsp. malaysiensis]|uniref:Uncharacterized protein n=1 Tax=Streptomyces malaysiensis TaxID=92644 RepID=A0ABX6WIR9_STRMQ|nr:MULTISPECIES: hypothetical protein [Streptomyces]QPI61347.1 hypothetical protein I1A49_46335 [Streptomyces solisilvae]UHH23120.1 hypothetical protein LUV23_46485 [Streptomyces sp. HNM0561]
MVAAGELVEDEDAARLLLTATGAYAGVAPGRAVRAYLAALRRLPTDYPGRVRILRTTAVLAWRDADPAGLLALGEPLCATVEAGPGAIPADLAGPAAAWGLTALYLGGRRRRGAAPGHEGAGWYGTAGRPAGRPGPARRRGGDR